ncbi:MAG: 1,4-dihydroxy-2-naphthoate polyprenyltransferase [Deltaproteobacteria bacterium]|nr:1,4-dihydroxy-2-naphthoate polyprenyltransferase [Deltaproteobacteria bacterium]
MTTAAPLPPPSRARAWWLTLRPATLWAGAAPVLVGAALAARDGRFAPLPAAAALAGACLIQVGCNLVNDYSDFEKGADDDARLGPARAAARGWLSVRDLKRGAALSLGLAALLGVYLTAVGGAPILALGVASLLSAVAYTAGPLPLAYVGLGDLFVLLFFGLGAVGGTYYLLAGALSAGALAAGAAVGALATAILVVNNLRDRHGDARAGKRTLAVRWGATAARVEYSVLLAAAFAFVGWRAAAEGDAAWLAPLAALPLALHRARQVWVTDGAALNPLLGATARLELIFCLALSVALALSSRSPAQPPAPLPADRSPLTAPR